MGRKDKSFYPFPMFVACTSLASNLSKKRTNRKWGIVTVISKTNFVPPIEYRCYLTKGSCLFRCYVLMF